MRLGRGLALGMLLVACTSGHPPAEVRSPLPGHSSSPAPPDAARRVTHLPELVLDLDLSQPPEPWRRVMFLAFGPGEDRLGFHHFHESTDSLPSSFQVDADGSFWIADRWKSRLAHYDASGAFLGAIAVPAEGSRIRDFAIAGGKLLVVTEGGEFALRVIDRDGASARIQPRIEAGFLAVNFVYPAEPAPVFQASNLRVPPRWTVAPGPGGIWTSDPAGRATLLPGIPAGEGRWLAVAATGEASFEFHRIGVTSESVLPFRLRCHVRVRPTVRSVPIVATVIEPVPVEHGRDLLMMVQMSPTRPGDAERFGGGRWLLRLGSSPMLWERMDDPDRADEPLWRHLAVGPEGEVYQMVARRRGMEILRRP